MKQPFLLGCLFLAAATGAVRGQTVRSLAEDRGIYFGAAVTFPENRAVYQTTLEREFNGLVCENAMKFGNIMTGPNSFNYSEADAIVNFGVSHGMYVRGHTFIWHKQNPTWFMNLNVSRDSAFKIMERYITSVMTHFRGKIKEWDIVNEAVARDSSGMRLGSGYADESQNSKWTALTDAANHDFDYIDSAFTYARRADSSVLLFYNDYNTEGMGKKADMAYDIVAHLKSLDLVDGVGLQCHFHLSTDSVAGPNGSWSPSELTANLDRLAALGLIISFTEVDIRIPNAHTPMTAEDSALLIQQRDEYYTLMKLFLAQPQCRSFFVWGINDAQSWIPDFFDGYGSCLLFSNTAGTDGQFERKTCYYGVLDALSDATGIQRYSRKDYVRTLPGAEISGGEFDLLGRSIEDIPRYPRNIILKSDGAAGKIYR